MNETQVCPYTLCLTVCTLGNPFQLFLESSGVFLLFRYLFQFGKSMPIHCHRGGGGSHFRIAAVSDFSEAAWSHTHSYTLILVSKSFQWMQIILFFTLIESSRINSISVYQWSRIVLLLVLLFFFNVKYICQVLKKSCLLCQKCNVLTCRENYYMNFAKCSKGTSLSWT